MRARSYMCALFIRFAIISAQHGAWNGRKAFLRTFILNKPYSFMLKIGNPICEVLMPTLWFVLVDFMLYFRG